MIYQSRNPYPADWWSEKTVLGLSRNAVALILIGMALAIAFYSFDWSWVLGRR